MFKYVAALCSVLLVAPAAWAQDELKKEFPAGYVQDVLIKQAMNIKAGVKPDEHPQKKMSFYGTPDGEFDVEHHYGEKKFVFVYVFNADGLKLAPNKANDWNSLGLQSRAFHNGNGQVVLAGVLPYEAGLSLRQFLTFHLRLKAEMKAFEAFAKK